MTLGDPLMSIERQYQLSVVGPFSTITGGAEVVKVRIVDILLRHNYDVILAGLSRNSFPNLRNIIGYNVFSHIKTYFLMPWFPQLFGLVQPLVGLKAIERFVSACNPSLVIIDTEGSKTLDKLWKTKEFALIKYVNFPHSALLMMEHDPGKIPSQYLTDIRGYSRKYHSNSLWKIYWKSYLYMLERILPRDPVEADALIANSKYIAGLIKGLYDTEPSVIHPPVDTSNLDHYSLNPFEARENAVAMLGRLSSEKNFEEVIEAISQTEVKPVLRIIGAITRRGWSYVEFLSKLARKKKVKVEFYLNLPREELGKVLGSCRVFVHATRGEHFGIAIVEAMATGLPVIVHKSGGQYMDIVEEGRYGLYYSTIEELAEKIDYVLSDASLWSHYSMLAVQRSKAFSPDVFEERLISLLKAKSII